MLLDVFGALVAVAALVGLGLLWHRSRRNYSRYATTWGLPIVAAGVVYGLLGGTNRAVGIILAVGVCGAIAVDAGYRDD